ncbi:MAG: SUF system NifU family Fe-S cluster assembly protein [Calditrichaeota bacterium]|nr:MAG: SUF system NifU family Fe-S cluster assembly protein [Calditrichota bacterium]
MDRELKELYQQVILDHNRNPKNYGKLEPCSHKAEGYNPLCGDQVTVYLQVEDGVIKDIHFEGSGCAISRASASVMTTELKGKTVQEAEELFKKFQELVTSDVHKEVDFSEYGKLAVFAGVREFPTRVKCAILAWHTGMAALKEENRVVSTE